MLLSAAVVLVQITPPTLVEQYGERLITACTQGLRQGACVLAGGAAAEQPSALVAQVRWGDEAFRVVEIRLGLPGPESASVSGKVVFDDDDALADRWTTTGFTIATLVGELPQAPAVPPATSSPLSNRAEPEAPRSLGTIRDAGSSEARAQPAGPAERKWHVTAGGALGQAALEHDLRAGAWASLAYQPFGPPLRARLHAGFSSAAANDVTVRWATLAAGLELRWPLVSSTFHGLAGIEGGAATTIVSATRNAARTSGLVASYLGIEVSAFGPLALFLAGEVAVTPATNVKTEDSQTLTDRRVKLGALVGLGVAL